MKNIAKIVVFFILLMSSHYSKSQISNKCDNPNYNLLIEEGDAYLKAKEYTESLNSYLAAQVFCPYDSIAKNKITKLFDEIQSLKLIVLNSYIKEKHLNDQIAEKNDCLFQLKSIPVFQFKSIPN